MNRDARPALLGVLDNPLEVEGAIRGLQGEAARVDRAGIPLRTRIFRRIWINLYSRNIERYVIDLRAVNFYRQR